MARELLLARPATAIGRTASSGFLPAGWWKATGPRGPGSRAAAWCFSANRLVEIRRDGSARRALHGRSAGRSGRHRGAARPPRARHGGLLRGALALLPRPAARGGRRAGRHRRRGRPRAPADPAATRRPSASCRSARAPRRAIPSASTCAPRSRRGGGRVDLRHDRHADLLRRSPADDVATTDELWGRALRLIGVRPGDTVLHGFGLSMFLAGYPLVRAVERMGARIVPIGAEAGYRAAAAHGATACARACCCCTPSATPPTWSSRRPTVLGRHGAASSASRSSAAPASPAPACPRCAPSIQEALRRPPARHARRRPRRDVRELRDAPSTHGMHVLGEDYCGRHPAGGSRDQGAGRPRRRRRSASASRRPALARRSRQLRASVGDVYEMLTGPAPRACPGRACGSSAAPTTC